MINLITSHLIFFKIFPIKIAIKFMIKAVINGGLPETLELDKFKNGLELFGMLL